MDKVGADVFVLTDVIVQVGDVSNSVYEVEMGSVADARESFPHPDIRADRTIMMQKKANIWRSRIFLIDSFLDHLVFSSV